MPIRPWRCLALTLLFGTLTGAASSQELSPGHRRWLEEEAVYLITTREAEVFRSLATPFERDRFIEAFWRKRDPVSSTPANEFREEHYRRFDHANRELRGEAFAPGWRTDRGRMHIILGPPRSIERFEFHNNLHDTELWFYQGDRDRNLPSFFYLLFFRRQEAAEYRLFTPGVDTPGDLLRGPARSFPRQNMEQLRQISPELARAALAVDASEPVDFVGGTVGLGSGEVLARIESSPTLAVQDDDLDAWERYRDRVSAEYSFGFVPSESSFAVLYGPGRTPHLHFSVEVDLADLALDTSRDSERVFTTLDTTLEVRDPSGALVHADEKETFLRLTSAQLDSVEGSKFAYQDGAPLVPGAYEVMVILRNRVSSQYTVAEASVRVPEAPALGDIVLGFRTEAMPEDDPETFRTFRTFQAGRTRIHPAPGGVFPTDGAVHCAFQLLKPEPSQELHFALLAEGELVAERTRAVTGDETALLSEAFALDGAVPGRYEFRVRLRDSEGRTLAERSAPLSVSPRSTIPRAGVFARHSFDIGRRALLAVTLGNQHWAMGRFSEAEALFRQAVAEEDPEVPQAKWKLAAAHLRAGKAEAALALLLPLQYTHGDRYEVAVGLGLGFYLKQNHRQAVVHLEKAVSLTPPQPEVLNALGDAYLALGEPQKAEEAFRRSLEVNSEQPEIHERLATLGY